MRIASLTSAVALAALAGGCGGESDVARPAGELAWTGCGDGLACATFEVPIDEAHPDRGSFTLPVTRAPARGERIGVLIVNPGGPGGSGVALAANAPKFFPAEVIDRFDVVGFDPRGAAASKPAVACDGDLDAYFALDLTPDDGDERAALLDENKALAAGCEKASGAILPFVGSDRTVRDIDRLRDALGEETVSYLGYSYGTFLGANYAAAFPHRIRAMVLDGAVDPAKSGKDAILGQAFGFEDQLVAFFDAQKGLSTSPFFEDGDPAGAFDALMMRIDAAPIVVHPKTGPAREVGPGEAWWAVTDALYDARAWPFLAQALADAEHDDGARLLALNDEATGRGEDGTYDDSWSAYLAISNVDTSWPTTIAAYDDLADEVRKKAPRLGVALVYNSISPVYWPVPAERKPAPITAEGAPPIVVVGNTGDPATPYADAEALAKELATGTLLTWRGDGHTAFGGKSACIDDAVTRYLVDLTVPAKGKTCD